MPKKKKAKKKKRSLEDAVLNALRSAPGKPKNYKQIAALLGVKDERSRMRISSALDRAVKKGLIAEQGKGRYVAKSSSKTIVGRVDFTKTGAAYVASEELEKDAYIPRSHTGNALQDDQVKVKLIQSKRSKRPEGRILAVIERARKQIVGVIEKHGKKLVLVPDNEKIHVTFDIQIQSQQEKSANVGSKAIGQLIEGSKTLASTAVRIIEVLGEPGHTDVEVRSILADSGLPHDFPKEVALEAENINKSISPEEIKKRKDFREVTTFTIDPVDAKDFDDALSARKTADGMWEIGVHIADVSHYVKPQTLLDKEARNRAMSIYLVDRVVPMLPEVLSNELCSLRPNEEKLCFSAVFVIDPNTAAVKNSWVGKTIISSDKRFTYEEAQGVLDQKKGPFLEELNVLNDIAKKLRAARAKKGAMDFGMDEVRFELDANGHPVSVFQKKIQQTNLLIEDFMLLANKTVAELLEKSKKANGSVFVFRVHDRPDPEKLKALKRFVQHLGYTLELKDNSKEITQSLGRLLNAARGKGEEHIVKQMTIRSMAKAFYTTDNIGHFGLSFDDYTHFTSPIRRYPDLLVHRSLFDLINKNQLTPGKTIETYCKHCSLMERKAIEAERESIKFMQVRYMMDKVGGVFSGVVSGVTGWGVFVELEENKCEGLIPLSQLQDDFYTFDEEGLRLVGSRKGNSIRLGDALEVLLKHADLGRRQLEFELVARQD